LKGKVEIFYDHIISEVRNCESISQIPVTKVCQVRRWL